MSLERTAIIIEFEYLFC